MTDCACVIRSSQGSDDKVSLQQQRREVPALAAELGDDDPAMIDLGIHTGFSIHSRDRDAERLDAHPAIEGLVDDLEAGAYDYLVAWDDRRIARDEYFHTIKRAATLGDCELAFVADVERDDLAHGVHRVVEREVKKEEIEKAKRAYEEWAAEAEWKGRPPAGLTFGPDGHRLVPDEEFDDVLTVLDRLDEGDSYRDIREDVPFGLRGISAINDRGRDFYEQFADRSSGR